MSSSRETLTGSGGASPDDDLVAECIEAMEARGPSALEDLCARHPSQATVLRERIEALRSAGVLDPPEPAPERIGPYRVLEELGTGGMGAVYLAQQREPIRRQVAIKVIKPGMDSRQVLTRFEVERQAMALMNHPHIAKVLDCGLTERERPYFVMDYVAGQKITEYCDRRSLSTEDRLELFLPLCEAVQHAHQKGIIHRDLKPSNILVREESGRGLATIIDFGVAKAMGGALTEQTLHTEQGRILGTPEYMSPEQAGRGEGAVDTRSDVYSLGVVLYELLSGVLPFESETLRGSGYDKLKQVLQEQDPPTPSTRVTGQDQASVTAAKARGLDVDGLRRRLKGDLDWITLRALEKDPARRYATPLELAADVRRHLANEAVLAGPPTLRYRLGKFVRRNRAAVLAGSAVMLAVFGGLVTSTWFYFDARAAQQQEKVALTQAQRDYDRMRVAVDAMLQQLADPRLTRVPGLEGVRTDLLKKAVGIYQEILDDHGEDDAVVERQAAAHTRVAGLLQSLGDGDKALHHGREAITRWERLLERENSPKRRLALVEALLVSGRQLKDMQLLDEADAAHERALELVTSIQPDPDNRLLRRRIASTKNAVGVLVARRDVDRALRLFSDAADEVRALVDLAPSADYEVLLAKITNNQAQSLRLVSDLAGAEKLLEQARARIEKVAEQYPDRIDVQDQLTHTGVSLSATWVDSRRRAKALPLLADLVEEWRELRRRSPLLLDYRIGLASTLNNYGVCLQVFRRFDEAREVFQESISIYEEIVEQNPSDRWHELDVVRTLSNLARTDGIEFPGKVSKEAVKHLRRAIGIAQAAVARDAREPVVRVSLVQAQDELAKLCRVGKDFSEAKRLALANIELLASLLEENDRVAQWIQSRSTQYELLSWSLRGLNDLAGSANARMKSVEGALDYVELMPKDRYAFAVLMSKMIRAGQAFLAAEDPERASAVVDLLLEHRGTYASAQEAAGRLAAQVASLFGRATDPAKKERAAAARERAFELLGRAGKAGRIDRKVVESDAEFDGLRGDPRYASWLEGLPLQVREEVPPPDVHRKIEPKANKNI